MLDKDLPFIQGVLRACSSVRTGQAPSPPEVPLALCSLKPAQTVCSSTGLAPAPVIAARGHAATQDPGLAPVRGAGDAPGRGPGQGA